MTVSSYRIPGSFRDPNSHVYEIGQRFFRGIKNQDAQFISYFLNSSFYKERAGTQLVKSWAIEKRALANEGFDKDTLDSYELWIEHSKLPLITYPYEWSFLQLQRAAVFHLDLQIDALKADFQIKDASAFNIQFIGTNPIFIDLPSFTKYKNGEPWVAYKQFCEMFLAPLVIHAFTGINAQAYFKCNLNGISIPNCSKILPWSTYLNVNILGHIHAQAYAAKSISAKSKYNGKKERYIKKENLVSLLSSMRKFIASLKSKEQSYWDDYEDNTSYSHSAAKEKDRIVFEFSQNFKGKRLLDIGCNAGRFSEIAFDAGVSEIIGLDIDSGALDKAFTRPKLQGKNFYSALYDFLNPSPALGWGLSERTPLSDRLPKCDGLICLALIHHITIGGNVPMAEFVKLLTSLARSGLIEFPSKKDPMVKGLLANRDDIFEDYDPETFETELKKHAVVQKIKSNNETRFYFQFAPKT